jgi:hypothetical protein
MGVVTIANNRYDGSNSQMATSFNLGPTPMGGSVIWAGNTSEQTAGDSDGTAESLIRISGNGGRLTNLNASQLTSIGQGQGNFFVGPSGGASFSGSYNAAIGVQALASLTSGNGNTALGYNAFSQVVEGDNNIAIGNMAGYNLTNGENDIYIGNEDTGESNEVNTIRIGTMGTQTTTFIAGIYEASNLVGTTLPVVVDENGHLGTSGSSERFKENIKNMDDASDALLSLRPVTFQYKPIMDPRGTKQFGLVAEEVEKVAPDLVARDAKGRVFTVRYDAINAMLLNEFLKQHSKVAEQNKEIQDLKESMADLKQTVQNLAEKK